MPINAIDSARLDGLTNTAKTLLKIGINPTEIPTIMANEIFEFQNATGLSVRFDFDPATRQAAFRVIQATVTDYIKVSKPNQVRLLSAKLDGVTMSANLHKPQYYNHDNSKIAQALRRLADRIDAAPVRLADRDTYTLL